MNNFKRIENIFVLTDFIHWLIPLFLSIVSVGVEVLTKDEISIENIIVAIEIYDSLAYPLYRIPIFISSLLNTILSMKRLESFLNEENIEETKEKLGEDEEGLTVKKIDAAIKMLIELRMEIVKVDSAAKESEKLAKFIRDGVSAGR